MRTSIVAADGYDIAAGAAAFDALELDAEQRGWSAPPRCRASSGCNSRVAPASSVPTEVTGPELARNGIRDAESHPPVNFLRRHRDLVTASLYQHVKVQAMSRRGRPDPAHLLAMYAIARVLDDLTLVVEARLLWSSLLRSAVRSRAERHLNVAVAASATADGRTRFCFGRAGGDASFRIAIRRSDCCVRTDGVAADGDPDKIGIAEALADCCREMGLFAKAIDACTRAATLAEQLGWAERVARLLELRGLCHEDRGDYERGRSDYLRVARLAEQRGDRTTQLAAMNNAAGSLLKRGLAREGYVAFREVMRTIERWGNSPAAAAAHNNLGQALLQLERYTEAREHFLRSLQLRMNTGHRAGEIISMIGAGDAAEGMGDAEAARLWYTLAYIPILESGDTASLASIQMRLSDQALLVDDRARQEAIESLRGVRDEVRARSMTTLDAITTHRLAELLDATGDSATALHELHALLARAGDLGSNYVRPARIARARMLSRTRATWADGFTELRGILGEIEAQLAESRIDARKSEIIGETVALYEAMMRFRHA
ncbi:MAG: tetratricopeptide repeat protein [Gemmatimonadetes bacterium]|nr:tetratricopeptide repeat protein [Gemmatimonadota bacterium]